MHTRSLLTVGALLVVAASAVGCGGDTSSDVPGLVAQDPVGHVHALGVEKDGTTLIATHNGLFRAGAGDRRASRLGDERRDVMGFTIADTGIYLGSGHPDVRSGGPTSVGLVRSMDGVTWTTVSLSGRADLHVLETRDDSVVGFDALSGRLLASRDLGRTWTATSVPPTLDLAIDPTDADRVVISTSDGLLVSSDGARSFRPVAGLPPSLVIWTADALVAVDDRGAVLRVDPVSFATEPISSLPSPAAALAADRDGALHAATHDGAVFTSSDGGATWSQRLAPIVE